jgi:uncharacterized protein YjbI with pentapeptide repeats
MLKKVSPPFLCGTKVTSRAPGRLEMTVIVRAAFRLRPGEPVVPIESPVEAGPLLGDTFSESDEERAGELLHASDFADFKLKADVLLRGSCWPGNGATARERLVRFSVGGWSKSLAVFGRRVWTERIGDPISEPAPFTSMPITWANAFGGPEHPANPAGKGFKTPELPTIEDPRALVTSRRDAPAPACFGPVSPAWPARAGKVGKEYGKSWKKTRAPFYAEDFDWSYFNAAPPDQQLDYLRGDEALSFEHLHPAAARFSARLPGLRPRALVRTADGAVREPILRLDTLLADLDAEKVCLTWRGLCPVAEDDLADVRTLWIGGETLAEPLPRERCLADLESFERNPTAPEHTLPPDAKAELDRAQADLNAARQQLAAAQAEAERAPGPPPAQAADPFDRLSELARSENAAMDEGQRAQAAQAVTQLQEMFAANQDKVAALTAGGAPPPTRAAADLAVNDALVRGWARAAAQGRPTGDIEAAQDALSRARAERSAAEAQLREQAKTDPAAARVAGALDVADGAPSPPEEAAPPAAEPGPGADLTGRDLAGRDLRGLDLTGALLRNANLAGAKLAGTGLRSADLSGADLTGADLTGADLTKANLTEARAGSAIFDRATFQATIFWATELAGASFCEARCEMSVLTNANLRGAALRKARFFKTFFGDTRLDAADASDADLDTCMLSDVSAKDARFDRARLFRTSFLRADLAGASFVEASGEGSAWRSSALVRADFRHAVLPRSHFGGARLDDARMSASDLRESRFERSSLARTDLSAAQLLSASFPKALLADTVFRGACLYDAKLIGAIVSPKCDFEGANVKRAVWEQP